MNVNVRPSTPIATATSATLMIAHGVATKSRHRAEPDPVHDVAERPARNERGQDRRDLEPGDELVRHHEEHAEHRDRGDGQRGRRTAAQPERVVGIAGHER